MREPPGARHSCRRAARGPCQIRRSAPLRGGRAANSRFRRRGTVGATMTELGGRAESAEAASRDARASRDAARIHPHRPGHARAALIFQPFSLWPVRPGLRLVVVAGLANNLLPLCDPGVPSRSVLRAGVIVADIFCAMLLTSIAAAHLYGVFFVNAIAPDLSDPFYLQPFVWGVAATAVLLAAAIWALRPGTSHPNVSSGGGLLFERDAVSHDNFRKYQASKDRTGDSRSDAPAQCRRTHRRVPKFRRFVLEQGQRYQAPDVQ